MTRASTPRPDPIVPPVNLLDRYVAKQYLINVLTLIVILFSFVVAVDIAINMDRFIRTAARLDGWDHWSMVRRALVTILLIANLWWPRLLQLFGFMLGLVLVGAMGFTFAQMVRHRELVAVLASGQSLRRMARPILIVAAGMTVVQVINQEFVLPQVAPLLTRDHGDAWRRDLSAFGVRLTEDSDGRLFLAKQFNPETQTITGLDVWVREDTGKALRRITADSAHWEPGGENGLLGAWVLTNPRVIPIGVAPAGADVPGPPTRIETDVDPTRLLLRQYEGLGQNLSWAQLATLRNNPLQSTEVRATMDRIRFGRISVILSNFLALVIAMPFFLLREPKNMVIQSLKCAPIATGAVMGGILGAAAPVPGLPAAFAVFLPVLVMTPVAIAMATSVRT